MIGEIIAGIILGLIVNEITDISPWLAQRLVRWAASRWTDDHDLAATYAEEWTAVIQERPGKIFKLVTALGFGFASVRRTVQARRLAGRNTASRLLGYWGYSTALILPFAWASGVVEPVGLMGISLAATYCFLVRMPSVCGAMSRAGRCRNNAYGLLWGCPQVKTHHAYRLEMVKTPRRWPELGHFVAASPHSLLLTFGAAGTLVSGISALVITAHSFL